MWDNLEELRQTVREFMKFADGIKISNEELEFITGCKTIEAALPDLFAHRAGYVVYTMGQDGAAVYIGNGMVQVPGYSVGVRDTTGAGDSFIGAFLFCLLRDGIRDLQQVPLER